MILTINTANNGVLMARVSSTLEAARLLERLMADGIKPIRWELQRCVNVD